MTAGEQAGPGPDARRAVRASAPVRVADVGGWTDTWFGSPGQVCSIAVGPGVEVLAELHGPGEPGRTVHDGSGPVHLMAPDLAEDYRFGPEPSPVHELLRWDDHLTRRQPLLEHAVAEALTRHPLPVEATVRITISSAVPVGASLGTSASVLVALLGALDGLLGPAGTLPDPADLARRAHEVETGRAGREAGVQDHWAAAMGHAQHLVIDAYPSVRSRRLDVADAVTAELADRLVTVVFGPHDSSAVHGEVVHALLTCDGVAHDRVRRATRTLTTLAADAASALEAGGLDAWAEVLTRSTEAQAELHPGLVGRAHQAAIEVARSLGAAGWKVNGAGGAGGSLTVVAGRPEDGAASAAVLRDALTAADPTWRVVDLAPSGGLTVGPAPVVSSGPPPPSAR